MGPVVSEKKIFYFFSHSKSMETINSRGMAKFDPRGMNGIIYVEDNNNNNNNNRLYLTRVNTFSTN